MRKIIKHLPLVSCILALFLLTDGPAFAQSDCRIDQGYERALQEYLLYSEERLAFGLSPDSSAAQLAELNWRLLRRYQASQTATRTAKLTLRQRINRLGVRIKQLKKRAQKLMVTNLKEALKLWKRVGDLELQLLKLKRKLAQGDCPPAKTKLSLIFENNSDYPVTVYLIDSKNMGHKIGTIAAVRIGKFNRTLKAIQRQVGTATTVNFKLLAIIDGSYSWVDARMSLAKLPRKKPCKRAFRFELFNRTFPTPKGEYGVFTIPCPYSYSALFVGGALDLSRLAYWQFRNCGKSTATINNATKIRGATNQSAAEQLLCGAISGLGYFSGEKYYLIGDKRYWGFHSSVQNALTRHCPSKR